MAKDTKKEADIHKKYPLARVFKDFWDYAEGYKKQVIIYLVLSIITALIAMAPPYLYGTIIDQLTEGIYNEIFILLGFLAISHICFQVLSNFVVYKTKLLSSIIRNQARIKAFRHLFGLDYEFYEKNPLGKLFARIDLGSQALREFVKIVYKTTFVRFFGMFFAAIFLFSINWIVGLFAAVFMLVYFMYGFWSSKVLLNLENRVHRVSEKVYSKVYDFFSHILIVKLLNIKEKLIGILSKSYESVIDEQKKSRKFERQTVAVSKLMIDLAAVAVLTYLAVEVMGTRMTIGKAVMIYGFFIKFADYSKKLYADYQDLIAKRTGMYRLSLIYNNTPTIGEPKVPVRPKNWNRILFDDVVFKYSSKKTAALKETSLVINKGEKVAIVGLSGSGKSTFAKLLLKLYLPNEGKISIGNVDIRNIHSDDLYNMIKIVPQDNELMDATIIENLEMAVVQKVNKKDFVKSLKDAAAWDFVKRLPKKLDTHVGPQGIKISGGEKQRLCIARALLSKPEVLVLDEATSNLDVITEKKVHTALHKMPRKMTIIAITHRISSVYLFDRIIVMDKGRIVGEGTHKKLLRKNKYYKKLQAATQKEIEKKKN